MFTGIIAALEPVQKILSHTNGGYQLTLRVPSENLYLGASVSINGVCLTVCEIQSNGSVSFDVIPETLNRSNLGALKEGDKVNIERSARFGDEIGGHLLSGHVVSLAKLIKIEANRFFFEIPSPWERFIFEKGYIALDGASLTVVSIEKNVLEVHLIPETLQRTTFGFKKGGAFFNLEIDALTQAVVTRTESLVKSYFKDKI